MNQQVLTNKATETPYLKGLSTKNTLFKTTKPPFYQSALKALDTAHIPSSKEEYWKYSKFDKISNQSFDNQVNKSKIELQHHPPFICAAFLVFDNDLFNGNFDLH